MLHSNFCAFDATSVISMHLNGEEENRHSSLTRQFVSWMAPIKILDSKYVTPCVRYTMFSLKKNMQDFCVKMGLHMVYLIFLPPDTCYANMSQKVLLSKYLISREKGFIQI